MSVASSKIPPSAVGNILASVPGRPRHARIAWRAPPRTGATCRPMPRTSLAAGGVIVPPPGYLLRALELCRERGMLLVMTRGFLHVTSHVSDPLPAAAGLAVLDVIEEDHLVARAAERGDHLMRRLRELQDEHEQVGEVRGRGLRVGLELVCDRDTREPADTLGAAVTEECLRCGLSMNIVRSGQNANCLRMAPPLSVSEDEIDTAVEILDVALRTSVARTNAPSTAT